MTSLSNRLLTKVNPTTRMPTVFVEKSAVDPSGQYAKVLFRIGTTSTIAKTIVANSKKLMDVFDARLNGAARLLPDTVHASDISGMYCGYVRLAQAKTPLNAETKKNFRSITANLFADEEDNMWTVQSTADGHQILVKNSEDNLQELLNTRMSSPSLHVASAGYSLVGSVTAGCVVAYFDKNSETIENGFTVDPTSVFDFKTHQVKSVVACDYVAASAQDKELAKALNDLFDDNNAWYSELSSVRKDAVVRYLTALYGQNRDFLNTYLQSIDQFLAV